MKNQSILAVTGKSVEKFTGDLVVYCAGQQKNKMPLCEDFVKKIIQPAWKTGGFSGKKGEFLLAYTALTGSKRYRKMTCGRIGIVGLGETASSVDEAREQLRLAGGTVAAEAKKCKAKKVLVVLPEWLDMAVVDAAEALSEGLLLGNYCFDKYKEKKGEGEELQPVRSFMLAGAGSAAAMRRGMKSGRAAALAACRARDMANEPGNIWTPAKFADFAEKLAGRYALKCRIIEKPTMKKLGMGGLLAVNQGSDLPPKLVVLEYISDKKNPTLMLVGKGLTFDSGGISLKPAKGMEDMKYDMCGGAAVLTTMQVVGEERPGNVNVVALVPATDNMSGAAAFKPGDIITHFGGKTSEVINTDAEGRLILADALAWGIKTYAPDAVVDLATLTGAVIIGLGHHRTGLLSNNDSLAQRVSEAGERSGEPFWRLPLGPEYSKQLESKVADLKNVGGRSAGTITAAAYLQEFIGDTPWAHCDVAGTAWNFTEKSYVPKGPSGIAVRTLVTLIRQWKPLQ
ncbi:MAG TPA: leucyl aminopeptidase [Desulfobulbaceae bacterium]|nr:leucyl aminopeptidase [Desulfobulbaceae bacterium]